MLPSMPTGPRLLVVEDDDAIRKLLVRALQRAGFAVDAAPGGAGALQLAAVTEYAVIILDLMMPGMSGFEFIDAFHAASPAARSVILVITASTGAVLTKLDARRVHAVIRKPFDLNDLVSLVQGIAGAWNTHAEPAREPSAPIALVARPAN
jgi:DNA-binding response OmpR family regulator